MMGDKIIRVTPVPECFSITWMLGSRCNYDCMYCPAELHDNTSRPHDLETMQTAWKNIFAKANDRGLPFKINFTGGEVTANKNFLPLVRWLRENYPEINYIGLTTNGSASLSYYKKLSKLVEFISFSIHSEFMHESKFFEKALIIDRLMIRPKKSFHVNVMNEYWNQDRIKIYVQWLTEHNISHSVQEINYSRKVRENILKKGIADLEILPKSI